MGRCFDMRKKQDVSRIANNLTEPEALLNKVINAIKVKLVFESCVVPRSAQQQVHSGNGKASCGTLSQK
jgi:hypothetical protein